MRQERQWYYIEGEGDDAVMHYTPDPNLAQGTQWVFTDVLEDGSEYGLMVNETDVSEEPSEFILRAVTGAMDRYLKDQGP